MRSLIIAFFLTAVCLYPDQVTYKYDDAGRLILVDYGNGQTIAYTYDNAGNLLTRAVTAGGGLSSQSAPKAKSSEPRPPAKRPVKSSRRRPR